LVSVAFAVLPGTVLHCGSCGQSADCVSNNCTNSLCIVQDRSIAIGGVCCNDAECNSGVCQGGICSCWADSQCNTATQFCGQTQGQTNCAWQGSRSATCLPKATNCECCLQNSNCAAGLTCHSDHCVSLHSVNNGAACCVNAQCISGLCCGGICHAKNVTAVGETCCSSAQCVSGFCSVTSATPICRCRTDSHCPSSQYCDFHASGTGCVNDKPICGSCSRNTQCAAPATCTGGRCLGPITAGNFGDQCCLDKQCTSGSCSTGLLNNVCQCRAGAANGGGCNPATEFCLQGAPGTLNTCVARVAPCTTTCASCACTANLQCAVVVGSPAPVCNVGLCVIPNSVALGGSCCRDAQCTTGKCSLGQCVCTRSTQCAAGQVCVIDILGANVCVSGVGLCGTCDPLTPCQRPFTCIGGICVGPKTALIGDACCSNAQCLHGTCGTDNKCTCNSDTDCHDGSGFAKCLSKDDNDGDEDGARRCFPAPECGICETAAQCPIGTTCASGRCARANHRLSSGSSCCRDVQCASNSCNILGKCA